MVAKVSMKYSLMVFFYIRFSKFLIKVVQKAKHALSMANIFKSTVLRMCSDYWVITITYSTANDRSSVTRQDLFIS